MGVWPGALAEVAFRAGVDCAAEVDGVWTAVGALAATGAWVGVAVARARAAVGAAAGAGVAVPAGLAAGCAACVAAGRAVATWSTTVSVGSAARTSSKRGSRPVRATSTAPPIKTSSARPNHGTPRPVAPPPRDPAEADPPLAPRADRCPSVPRAALALRVLRRRAGAGATLAEYRCANSAVCSSRCYKRVSGRPSPVRAPRHGHSAHLHKRRSAPDRAAS